MNGNYFWHMWRRNWKSGGSGVAGARLGVSECPSPRRHPWFGASACGVVEFGNPGSLASAAISLPELVAAIRQFMVELPPRGTSSVGQLAAADPRAAPCRRLTVNRGRRYTIRA